VAGLAVSVDPHHLDFLFCKHALLSTELHYLSRLALLELPLVLPLLLALLLLEALEVVPELLHLAFVCVHLLRSLFVDLSCLGLKVYVVLMLSCLHLQLMA